MFLCVEQDYKDDPVIVQYSNLMEQEADGIILVMTLYLQGKFGTEANKWFKASFEIGSNSYVYDDEHDRVVPAADSILQVMNDEWDQAMDEYDIDSLSDHGSLDGCNGFSIEFGALNLDARGTKTTLKDDSESAGIMGFQKPMDITNAPDELKARARSCLSSTYPSKVKPNYPLGIHFRFIPNTRDTEILSPTQSQGNRQTPYEQTCRIS